jgi:hypothetical protein
VNEPVCGGACKSSSDCLTTAIGVAMMCPDGSSVFPSYDCVNAQCTWVYPDCPTTQCKVDGDCPVSAVACQACPDGSKACPWSHCVSGQCTSGIDQCPTTQCKVDSDCPVSKVACQLCSDGTSACPYAHCVSGQCNSGIDTCPPATDPCAGKACGDTCQVCPSSGTCNGMQMYCDANLTCGVNQPVCGKVTCSVDSDCGSGQICVDQIGGPGPAQGFECATQNPCGSALRCACIVGQGTCTQVSGTNQCQCDNGLR